MVFGIVESSIMDMDLIRIHMLLKYICLILREFGYNIRVEDIDMSVTWGSGHRAWDRTSPGRGLASSKVRRAQSCRWGSRGCGEKRTAPCGAGPSDEPPGSERRAAAPWADETPGTGGCGARCWRCCADAAGTTGCAAPSRHSPLPPSVPSETLLTTQRTRW